MIEPEAPVTIHVEETPSPALTLTGDQKIRLYPHTVVLRHRHVRQQYTVILEYDLFDSGQQEILLLSEMLRPTSEDPLADILSWLLAPQLHIVVPPHPNVNTIDEQSSQLDASATSARHSAPVNQHLGVQKPVPQTRADPAPGVTINIASAEVRMQAQQPVLAATAVQSISDNPSCVLLVERHEHMIRGLKDKTVWFSSRGEQLLAAPVAIPSSQLHQGDLFVHVATGNRKQVWLWNTDEWVHVELHHPHPYLRGYVLNILSNGEPSWVTKDTIRTYISRIKKWERERSGKSAAPE
ncbi:hypothetical protein C8T65DRAFT_745359 [Cerioporus squamosus]|nr:hypothetical protein C8T65DRAFT_745359 [Cerioporus squamosus]